MKIKIFYILSSLLVFFICLGLITSFAKPNEESRIPQSSMIKNDSKIPKKVGIFPVNKPAFITVDKLSEDEPFSVFISSFSTKNDDQISYIPDIASKLNDLKSIKPINLSDKIVWPNEALIVPFELFNKKLLISAGGFLVPGKNTGAISIIDVEKKQTYKISQDKNSWFYHSVIWKDMNNDGKFDILTARATKPLLGDGKGELVWFENPGAIDKTWQEHKLCDGPDVFICADDLDNNGTYEIIATQFFTKKLAWFDNSYNPHLIDNKIGSPFASEICDLNKDGKKDLLVTNHESNNGSVFAYEIPSDLKTNWEKHTLLTNIKTLNKGFGEASPGRAFSFYPTDDTSGKPYIIVAGDGSQKAHLLVPMSNDINSWEYEEVIILDTKCTVGQIAVQDINNDGYKEIFIPAYENNEVHVFTYNPN